MGVVCHNPDGGGFSAALSPLAYYRLRIDLTHLEFSKLSAAAS